MKPCRRLLFFSALAAMLLGQGAAPRAAWATTVIAMSLAELTEEAELVAIVEGIGADPFWSGARVMTQVRMRVLEVWKSERVSSGDLVDVLTLGGEVGPIGQVVAGAARLPQGEPLVLFLRGARSHTGEYHVVGMGQGAWHLAEPGQPLGAHARLLQSDVDHAVGGAGAGGAFGYTLGQLREAVKEHTHGRP